MPNCSILLVKPDVSVSTKYVYENLCLNEDTQHPDIPAMLEALQENNIHKLAPLMENILESVTIKEYPIIEEIKVTMKNQGAIASLMSGSGPTVFGIFDNQLTAEKAYRFFKSTAYGRQVILTRPY
jgi:4-diphosphocytidyl-2-C-methyl-D-erythritol kinase